jgi:hypothetical protein
LKRERVAGRVFILILIPTAVAVRKNTKGNKRDTNGIREGEENGKQQEENEKRTNGREKTTKDNQGKWPSNPKRDEKNSTSAGASAPTTIC